MKLYAHPFSSFCQKALIALYETGAPFEYRHLEDPGAMEELAVLWPMKRFPILVDGDRVVLETAGIIEYLDAFHPGPTALIPADPALATETRMMDRIFDNYVSIPQQQVIFITIRPPEANADPWGVQKAREMLETSYAWLDRRIQGREWAVGDAFSMADCAAAPALFYADWTHPIPPQYEALWAYRRRLLARPSVARCVDEARPYRGYFPLGAPDRD